MKELLPGAACAGAMTPSAPLPEMAEIAIFRSAYGFS